MGQGTSKRITNAELQKQVGVQDERMVALEDTVDQTAEVVNATADKLDILIKNFTHSQEYDDPNETGDSEAVEVAGEQVIEVSRIKDVDSPEFKDKEATLAFFEEMVHVQINETFEENADKAFFIGVNGKQWGFQPGNDYVIPRFVLNGLVEARPVHYECVEYLDSDGVRKNKYPHRRGPRYPYQVLKDTDRGLAWLRGAQAA